MEAARTLQEVVVLITFTMTKMEGWVASVLFDEGIQKRWQAVYDQVNIYGVSMWDESGNPTGILL